MAICWICDSNQGVVLYCEEHLGFEHVVCHSHLCKAERMIEKDNPLIYDVAANMFPAQIVANVKHTSVFKKAVVRWLENESVKEATEMAHEHAKGRY